VHPGRMVRGLLFRHSMSRLTNALAAQHRRVIELLDEAQENAKKKTLHSLADHIVGHMVAEEEIVYPVAATPAWTRVQALEEHAILRYALDRLLVANPSHLSFDARVRMLRELLLHHCDREERARLPQFEKAIGARRSRLLATRVEERYAEVVAQGYARHRKGLRDEE